MSADKRTRAQLLEQLGYAELGLHETQKALTRAEEGRKADKENRDPEAVAVEQCVRALQALRDTQRASSRNQGYGTSVSFDLYTTDPGLERVLSYLRRRFNLPDQSGEVAAMQQRLAEVEQRATEASQRLEQIRQSAGWA